MSSENEMTLNEWIYATTPCPSCGGPNAPIRSGGDPVLLVSPSISKGKECEKCFKLKAFAKRLKAIIKKLEK